MKQPQFKRELKSLSWSMGIVILTIILSFILVLKANGYIVDLKRLKVEKAGLLVVKPIPVDAEVKIDGKSFRTSLVKPYFIIFPGLYDITISKEQYHSWQRSIDLDPGEAEIFENVWLFLKDPILQQTREPTTIELDAPLIGEGLRINEGEIWLQEEDREILVTRLSVPVTSVARFGQRNIVFQTNSALNVIDRDGSNNIRLLDVKTTDPVRLIPLGNYSQVLVIKSPTEASEYQVR